MAIVEDVEDQMMPGRIFGQALSSCGRFCLGASKRLYQSPDDLRMALWRSEKGDRKLRLVYDLEENSLVFDVGGYEGQWASDIFAMYACKIHVFEPIPEFAAAIQARFARNKKIVLHSFGLSAETRRLKISVDRDASSIFRHGKNEQEVDFVSASEFMDQNHIHQIDLMKMNIEGGEYELLTHLIDTELIQSIKNIQVQFHDFVSNAQLRMKKIQDSLSVTHSLTYQYPFVWENWTLR